VRNLTGTARKLTSEASEASEGIFQGGSILYKKSASDTSDGSDAKEEPQKQDVRKERKNPSNKMTDPKALQALSVFMQHDRPVMQKSEKKYTWSRKHSFDVEVPAVYWACFRDEWTEWQREKTLAERFKSVWKPKCFTEEDWWQRYLFIGWRKKHHLCKGLTL
jgi:hypothetical protein